LLRCSILFKAKSIKEIDQAIGWRSLHTSTGLGHSVGWSGFGGSDQRPVVYDESEKKKATSLYNPTGRRIWQDTIMVDRKLSFYRKVELQAWPAFKPHHSCFRLLLLADVLDDRRWTAEAIRLVHSWS